VSAGAGTLDELARAGPDPEGAGPYLARFVEAGGRVPDDAEGRRLLVALLSNGSYLANLLLADVPALDRLARDPFLRRPKPRDRLRAETAAACAEARDLRSVQRGLRRHFRGEMLRLGAREIGWGTTLEVAHELSALADASLEEAVRVCDGELRAGYGAPQARDRPPGFVVLGMGKLGGEELNFSSDVDLVYVYATDEGAAGTLTLHEYYARLSQMVTRALSESTDDGMLFRVDLRLRPEGRSGAICNSLAAAERYYETFGRTWERQALLRARPSAGDQALGAELLRMLEPFVFPRSVGEHAKDEVLALRRLFRQQAVGDGFDVKLGSGGIRDVELVAQLLQLLHAGKRPELRERSTLRALHKLAVAGLVSDREQRVLAEAYRFLRRVEHRVQLEDGSQTHALPTEARAAALLARRLGFPDSEALAATLERHRATVVAVSDTLGEPVSAPPAVVMRLLDPVSARVQIEADLREAGFFDVATSAEVLEQVQSRLPAAWLTEILTSPDPDRALFHFRELALGGSLGLFALLRDHPALLRMLATLFGTSDRLSRHLLDHPNLWQPLLEALGAPRLPAEVWRRALAARLEGLDEEEALREMRRYQAEEILRIGIHDVVGNLEAPEVSDQLTALADSCLAAAVQLVAARVAPRWGLPAAELAVLALGSFGARETRYGSDLDLVFLFAAPGTTAAGMDHQEWFARFSQRLIGALGALMDEGRLYEVDTRLRPSGAQGLLVTSYRAFDEYHHKDAAPWERVALLRARPVYVGTLGDGGAGAGGGGEAPGAALARMLEEVTYERPLAADDLRRDLGHVRGRIEQERGGTGRASPGADGVVHLRFSPGGLTDLEFLVAFEQLVRGRDDASLRTPTPFVALERLAARGLVPDGEALLDDYRFLARACLRLRLLRDQPDDRLSRADRPRLARSLGLGEAELDDELRARMARVRATYTAVLG
jgi:glutamate-ammonia-ligase adenylyltransferase